MSPRPQMCFVLLFSLLLFSPQQSDAQSSRTPSVTDLFTADEFQHAGLGKLSTSEMQALNAAMLRVIVQMRTYKDAPVSAEPGDELSLYDAGARAVAYVADEDDQTIYLWSGKPVAYLLDGSVFGFNGKHLGWFEKGVVYDHDGGLVAALASRFNGPVQTPGLKALKELRPLKSLRELKPLKPLFSYSWSETPARYFFLQGVE
jgi:hypothetical protein